LNTVIHCGSQSLMERQFQKEYTHAKFTEVQTGFSFKMNCLIHHCHSNGENCTYTVMEESIHNDHSPERLFIVFYDKKTKDVQCQCLLFEFRGIICRHSLVVLAQERQKSVPAKYILQRWSKNVRRKHNYIMTSFNSNDKPPRIQCYDALCERFGEIAEVAWENHETSELLFAHLQAFAHTHDMSHLTKAYNIETHYPAKTHLGDQTPQRNNSINDGLNTDIAMYQFQDSDDLYLKD